METAEIDERTTIVKDEKLALEYLKVLLDREAKENDRLLTRSAVYAAINAAAVGALATLAGRKDTDLHVVFAVTGPAALLFSILWYHSLVQSKTYQYWRQKDVADFIVAQGLVHIFRAESYSHGKPDRLLPWAEAIGSTHALAISASVFALVWFTVSLVGLLPLVVELF